MDFIIETLMEVGESFIIVGGIAVFYLITKYKESKR